MKELEIHISQLKACPVCDGKRWAKGGLYDNLFTCPRCGAGLFFPHTEPEGEDYLRKHPKLMKEKL